MNGQLERESEGIWETSGEYKKQGNDFERGIGIGMQIGTINGALTDIYGSVDEALTKVMKLYANVANKNLMDEVQLLDIAQRLDAIKEEVDSI